MLNKTAYFLMAWALVLMVGLIGCAKKDSESKEESVATTDTAMKAVAEMEATAGNEAHGTVTFTMTEDGMQVVAHFEGVPAGEHGFHIHENGDCSDDGKSAGGHFNPEGMPHAGPDAEQRHVGDLGNITADGNSVADADFVDTHLTFEGPNSIIGRGIILHADADDFTSQPTGAAGGRISCGVIEASK